ncbi:MAG: MelG protein (non-ribosomal peptide synthetase)-like protein [Ramlibacter sp.]|nr:MelG protein (non-ribosomal peptide synthetase)-like protein [Ramlibacter sp.]
MSSTSAVFIGDGSLLIRCAQAWQAAGQSIGGIASGNTEVLDWARANDVACVQLADDAVAELPPVDFDYLFSVANLRVLPANLVARAGKLAINFHDGPLPRYAGLNATSWALLAQETSYAITWHEMTAAVDAGRIVRQIPVFISPAETALGLNARCYEAGLAGFLSITQDIVSGQLALQEQSGERSYFSRARRPDALGTLDFSRPASELCALVRGLDFGSYANPLARAKIFLGGELLLVRSAQATSSTSSAAPGTVLRAEGDILQVATAQGDIELAGCSDFRGQPSLAGLSAGTVLPRIGETQRQALAACLTRVAKGETFWRKALTSLSPAELPYPRKADAARRVPGQFVRMPLRDCTAGARTVAGLFAWIAALTGQERVSALYCDAQLAAQAHGIDAWLTSWVPLTLDIGRGTRAAAAADQVRSTIEKMRAAGPCPRDLPTRLGEKVLLEGLQRIGVRIGGDASVSAEFDLLVSASGPGEPLELIASAASFAPRTIDAMAHHLAWWLKAFEGASESIDQIPLAPGNELAMFTKPPVPYDCASRVHDAIAAQTARTPDHAAISCNGRTLSYRELESHSAALAAKLARSGAGPGAIVGVCLPRSPELLVAVLAIWKTGAAYLPLDPEYPAERIGFMTEDSATTLVVTDTDTAALLQIPSAKAFLIESAERDDQPESAPEFANADANSAAYVIYTSGSTGRPKGVVVTHRNVMNFFAGMDSRIPHESPGRWLAVTSLSFDISVLELFWTLSRGFTVVLYSNTVQVESKAPDFSLFYFAADNGSPPQERYKLLLEGAKFADREGFSAIWTPERHFHAFGGLYPNPAVTSAAIAAMTTRLQIRAGSCVLPLHHPIRVAEEWAFVDNISQGRVGVSFASGWQPNDFVIAPEAFADRKNQMIANIDVVRRLWRGEKVAFPGPQGKSVEVQTLPRPIQKELPIWVTAAGNPETFQQAGEMGCHLLTHLLGQKIEDVATKLEVYRQAWRKAGHAGNGHVTLMLHTFVGQDEDEVRETVRGPMKEYLRSSVDLIKQAAWSFPTFVQRGAENGKSPVEIMDAQPMTTQEMDALLEHAFSRYYGTSALFGTPARCLELVEKLKSVGVDEIACLIDFGIDTETVLAHLGDLKALMDAAGKSRAKVQRASVAQELAANGITHLQCTPSMASMLVADAAGRAALSKLSVMMVGGEALPLKLAHELRALVPGKLLNMYGPTETTIWSTTCDLAQIGEFVPLGEPIANTQLAIRTPWGLESPALVPGELLIGGDGVAQGYWQRPDLNAERFMSDESRPANRLYRTGDLVRRHPDGALEFLGRIDHQVKIRGHRIELGEIESALARQAGVRQAVVVAREDASGDKRLAAYVTAHTGRVLDPVQLRSALAQELPEPMVPATVSVLPVLPLTPNGKVDRRALPEPQAGLVIKLAAAPQSQLEKTIASIWQEVLGLPQVGMSDNFFDLGGHSLLVVQVQRRLREACGHEVSITDMFRLPTIRALAAHLGGNTAPSAVGDGLNRANARRLMRSRAASQTAQTPAT